MELIKEHLSNRQSDIFYQSPIYYVIFINKLEKLILVDHVHINYESNLKYNLLEMIWLSTKSADIHFNKNVYCRFTYTCISYDGFHMWKSVWTQWWVESNVTSPTKVHLIHHYIINHHDIFFVKILKKAIYKCFLTAEVFITCLISGLICM